MRFWMPNFPCEFEIPDDWLAESGMNAFTRSTTSYRSTADAPLVSIHEIEPHYRAKTCENDWIGFDRAKMICVMKWIATETEIEAIPLIRLPELDERLVSTPLLYDLYHRYSYRATDGFHRFYASIAAGFSYVPARVYTVDDLVKEAKFLGLCK